MGTGGPKTAAGKSIARMNATKHGIRSTSPVLPVVEERREWERHLQATVESLAPTGCLELLLAQRIAHLFWRLHRVARYESEMLATQQETVEERVQMLRRIRLMRNKQANYHPEDVRGHLQWRKQALRAVRRFPTQPDGQKLAGSEAVAVLDAVEASFPVQERLGGESLTYTCAPEGWDPGMWAEYDGWTVGLVRQCLREASDPTGFTEEELLEAAEERARLYVVSATFDLESCEADVWQARREALILPAPALETVTRYESHLFRQLTSTLHELEALQSRRQGEATPRARLDVSGLPT